jgi:hypothetical protein
MTTREEIETFLDSIAKLKPKVRVRRMREMMKDPDNLTAAYSSLKVAKWVIKHERYM